MDAPAEQRDARPLASEPGGLVRGIDEPIQVGSMLWVFTDPLEQAGVARVGFGAPFVASAVGTDRYVDELW